MLLEKITFNGKTQFIFCTPQCLCTFQLASVQFVLRLIIQENFFKLTSQIFYKVGGLDF